MAKDLAPHEEQQLHFLLFTAVERYTERLEQRCGGPSAALKRLREEPEGEGIWLTQFADAIFKDFLLDNVGGACFILRALASLPAPAAPRGKTIGEELGSMALHSFAQALLAKTEEALERNSLFEPEPVRTGR